MAGAWYRIQQFCWAITARVTAEERRQIQQLLTPRQQALFDRLARADQRHSLDVYRKLVDWGLDDKNVLTAALLHDVGKALAPIHLWHRVAVVLIGKQRIARMASPTPGSRGYSFYVHFNHARLGADLVERADCPPAVVDLVRNHAEPPRNELARALQRADSEC